MTNSMKKLAALSIVPTLALIATLLILLANWGCVPPPPPIVIPPIPPAPASHVENMTVRSVVGVPINTATAKLIVDSGETFEALRDPQHDGRYQFVVPNGITGGAWLFVWADGHYEEQRRVLLHFASGEILKGCDPQYCDTDEAVILRLIVKRPPMRQFAPLGPLPDGGGGYNKRIEAAWPDGPPPRQGCDFVRADLWGTEIPGLPRIPGGSRFPRVQTWSLPRYGPQWFEPIMFAQAERGLTHFYLSVQDSMAPFGAEGRAVPPGDNMRLAEFVAMAKRIKHEYGFCVEVFLLSKYFSPHHAPAQTYIDMVAPIMDALIEADAVDGFVACWECNAFMSPGRPIIDYLNWVGERAHRAGKKASVHYLTHYTNWHADGDPRGRFGFWDDIRGRIDRLLYQSDYEWSAEDYQGRIEDTLKQINRQPWFSIVAFEHDAYVKWGNEHPNEDESAVSCMVGLLTLEPPARVGGYGFGPCRLPDGRPF